MDIITKYFVAVWQILAELAPWFLLGALVAGLMHGLAPSGFVRRRFSGYPGVVWSVVLGIPLPLCSCAVIPTGLGLRRNGASEGSSVSFLIATPQTGVDSVFVTAAFLGWTFAFYKLAVALVLGLLAGWLIEWLGQGRSAKVRSQDSIVESESCCCSSAEMKPDQSASAGSSTCCSTLNSNQAESVATTVTLGSKPVGMPEQAPAAAVSLVTLGQKPDSACSKVMVASEFSKTDASASCCSGAGTQPKETGSCCGSASKAEISNGGTIDYLQSSLASSLSIVRSIYQWVLLGVLISAALSTIVPLQQLLQMMGASYGWQLLAALLIGVPLYVCATASVPIAAALVQQGLSVGASVVFLMAGPATNVATIGAVKSQFSSLAFWVYMVVTIGGSLLAALLFDRYFPGELKQIGAGHHHDHLQWWNQLSAVLLVIVFAWLQLTALRKHKSTSATN